MAKLFNPEDLISQAEAAQLRGVSRASINQLVARQRLRSVVVGGKPYLFRAEVLNFAPDKGGRPPQAKSAPGTEKRATASVKATNGTSTGKKKGGKR